MAQPVQPYKDCRKSTSNVNRPDKKWSATYRNKLHRTKLTLNRSANWKLDLRSSQKSTMNANEATSRLVKNETS